MGQTQTLTVVLDLVQENLYRQKTQCGNSHVFNFRWPIQEQNEWNCPHRKERLHARYRSEPAITVESKGTKPRFKHSGTWRFLIPFMCHFRYVFAELTSILVTLAAASAAVQETSCKSSRKALLRPVDKSSTNVKVYIYIYKLYIHRIYHRISYVLDSKGCCCCSFTRKPSHFGHL